MVDCSRCGPKIRYSSDEAAMIWSSWTEVGMLCAFDRSDDALEVLDALCEAIEYSGG